jgi:4-diphosphocytidyl-2-C-methyl-D-erythritol kinase
MRDEIVARAHAKLNVFLRVLGRRQDGFHDIESVVLPLSLHDVVVVRRARRLSLTVSGEAAGALAGTPDDNIALVAARELASACGRKAVADIQIDKRIPVAAGLGGGSADAAATLRSLNQLWGCRLGDADLAAVGARVGSDVPAMLAGGPVFVSGRGERIAPVPVRDRTWVLAPFVFGVSAADAYSWWDERPETGRDAGALIAALEAGHDDLVGPALFNDLQGPVVRRHPEIAAVSERLTSLGALGTVMTGSGPTVVALARSLGEGERLAGSTPGSMVVSSKAVSRDSGIIQLRGPDVRRSSGVV